MKEELKVKKENVVKELGENYILVSPELADALRKINKFNVKLYVEGEGFVGFYVHSTARPFVGTGYEELAEGYDCTDLNLVAKTYEKEA